jgi:hypothetical protein
MLSHRALIGLAAVIALAACGDSFVSINEAPPTGPSSSASGQSGSAGGSGGSSGTGSAAGGNGSTSGGTTTSATSTSSNGAGGASSGQGGNNPSTSASSSSSGNSMCPTDAMDDLCMLCMKSNCCTQLQACQLTNACTDCLICLGSGSQYCPTCLASETIAMGNCTSTYCGTDCGF